MYLSLIQVCLYSDERKAGIIEFHISTLIIEKCNLIKIVFNYYIVFKCKYNEVHLYLALIFISFVNLVIVSSIN